jgi:putative SOS response-associated peptidase YedK
MCSTVNLKTKVTKTFFADLQPGPLELDYNIPAALAFTHPELPVLVVKNDKIEVVSMEWGIMPLFVNDPAERSRRRLQMINAQSERILNDKNSYWYRLRNHRCLIPLTGIFEHRKIAGWKKKVPYFVTTSDRSLFFIPGLYQEQTVMRPEGPVQSHTFTLITRAANSLMQSIHNDGPNKHRMPLFLEPELEHLWIQPGCTASDMRDIFSYELPDDGLQSHTVFTLRGERPDGREAQEPYEWENLPALGFDGTQGSLF